MLRVRLASLSDGLHTETLRPSAAELGLDPDVFHEIRVEVRLDVAGRRVLVAYEAAATATLECDRTLEPYDQLVEGEHAVLFVPPDSPLLTGREDEDVRPLADDAVEVDLAEPVRDTLLLSLPLRRVSPAARGIDLPTTFGGPARDELADDRWDALRALRDDDSGDGAPDTD